MFFTSAERQYPSSGPLELGRSAPDSIMSCVNGEKSTSDFELRTSPAARPRVGNGHTNNTLYNENLSELDRTVGMCERYHVLHISRGRFLLFSTKRCGIDETVYERRNPRLGRLRVACGFRKSYTIIMRHTVCNQYFAIKNILLLAS